MTWDKSKAIWSFFWLVLLLGLLVFGTTQVSAQTTFEEKLTNLEQILRMQIAYSETLETNIIEREILLEDLRKQIEALKKDLIDYQLYTQDLTDRWIRIDRQLTELEQEHRKALESSSQLEKAAIQQLRSKRMWQIIAGIATGLAVYSFVR